MLAIWAREQHDDAQNSSGRNRRPRAMPIAPGVAAGVTLRTASFAPGGFALAIGFALGAMTFLAVTVTLALLVPTLGLAVEMRVDVIARAAPQRVGLEAGRGARA